jgi:hypothetical protein
VTAKVVISHSTYLSTYSILSEITTWRLVLSTSTKFLNSFNKFTIIANVINGYIRFSIKPFCLILKKWAVTTLQLLVISVSTIAQIRAQNFSLEGGRTDPEAICNLCFILKITV